MFHKHKSQVMFNFIQIFEINLFCLLQYVIKCMIWRLYMAYSVNCFNSKSDACNIMRKTLLLTFEPRHEKNGFLHMRKQRRRSAPFF